MTSSRRPHRARRRPSTGALLAAITLVGAGCGSLEAPVAPAAAGVGAEGAAGGGEDVPDAVIVPSGTVSVAYPDEPASWLPALAGDAASVDLAALWGLPLYGYDEHGQLRPRLVARSHVVGDPGDGDPDGERWAVDLQLREGTWTDGSPVTARDVVVTLDALRAGPLAAELAPVAEVLAVETLGQAAAGARDAESVTLDATGAGAVVRVVFDEPLGRWAHVLADAGTMLPAEVLLAGDAPPVTRLEAWRSGLPVTGGSFQLAEEEPGLVRRFVAHPGSPLGAPRLEAIDVFVVPSYETALGLLRDGEVDAVIGHLALEPEARVSDRLDGFEVAAPLGGTVLTWRWEDRGNLVTIGASDRAKVHAALRLDSFAQGLLGAYGEVVDTVVLGTDGLWPDLPARSLAEVSELVLAAPRGHEAGAFAARAARDAVERRGGTVRVVSDEPDALYLPGPGDAEVLIRRLSPWPSLVGLAGDAGVGQDAAALGAADRADAVMDHVVLAGHGVLAEVADELPLVRVAVAHVWDPALRGMRPSAWPGAGLWAAATWSLDG